ncbi:MAG: outer membrane lipoprotein-sorting protein [Myxococcales bacterium]|jgi:hypothetical protein|nr:outer membrane lipoprotein-sorting protein [Myxococcales bacterium]
MTRTPGIVRRTVLVALAATCGLGILIPVGDVQAGPDAGAIMSKVATTRKLDGSEAVVKMSIIDQNGSKRERKLSMATKLYDGGKTEKRIYRFLEPADVKGTGVLVFDYEDKADDTWVFLPALRKTRRVVSSEKSKSFMGSEFSYADLNIPELSNYEYALVKEESVGGEACYVIEVKPKTPAIGKDEGYSKKLYWVSKSKHAVLKGHFFDLQGKLLKELTAGDVKVLDAKKGRVRALRMEMKNVQNGRRSVFETQKVAFTPDTKDEYFTTAYLERP